MEGGRAPPFFDRRDAVKSKRGPGRTPFTTMTGTCHA